MVIRSFEVGADEMPAVGLRSRQVAEEQFPEISWEHSHVVVDDNGLVRTFCAYDAPSEAMVREHARILGFHKVDAVYEIAGDVTPADFPG